jgi:hypothetical protein
MRRKHTIRHAKKLIQKHMIDLPPSLTEHEQIECLAYHLYER